MTSCGPSSSDSPRRPAPATALALLLSMLPAAGFGCSPPSRDDLVVGDELYVDIMTELVLTKDSLQDLDLPYWSRQQALDSVERVLAEERGVTAEDLFEYARVAGRDAARMQGLWETIGARVDSIRPPEAEADSAAGDEPPSRRRRRE